MHLIHTCPAQMLERPGETARCWRTWFPRWVDCLSGPPVHTTPGPSPFREQRIPSSLPESCSVYRAKQDMFNLEDFFTFKPTDLLKGQSSRTPVVVILKGPILQKQIYFTSFLPNICLYLSVTARQMTEKHQFWVLWTPQTSACFIHVHSLLALLLLLLFPLNDANTFRLGSA